MKKTQWLIASLIAIMASMVMTGCGGSAGTPPPDSNTTTGSDDNTTTGGDDNTTEVAKNTKLTIQKSDLGDCQDMRVQVWATKLTYQSSPPILIENDPSLYFIKEYSDQNISNNGGIDGNYTVDLGEHITINKYRDRSINTVLRGVAADDPELSKPIRLHATVFCGERKWGMKSLSYDMDNVSQGFYKSPFSLVLMFGRTFQEDDPLYPDRINVWGSNTLVHAIQSSVHLYSDYPTNSPDSVDKISVIKKGYEVYIWNNYSDVLGKRWFVWNGDDENWEFPSYGFIDAGTALYTALPKENFEWLASKVTLQNGKATYSDIVFKAEEETYLNFGVKNYPTWMPEP